MPVRTKKRRISQSLVPLCFQVKPENVEKIRRYVTSLESDEAADATISADDFFKKHFAGRPEWAVSLKGYRTREGLTQMQLADATGIPQRHISEMENGKRAIGKERAKLLAKALNADYRAFL